MNRVILIALFLGYFILANAQNVIIKKIELSDEKVIVHYELDDNNSNNEYLLNLYSSKDNFTAPLVKVKGDVGTEIKPGTNKKIEWSIRDEYGGYKGRLALEIRGRVYIPFIKLKDFDLTKTYKRGKSYDILWKAGNANPVHVELYKGSQRVQGDLNHPNNGSYVLSIPSKAKPGNDYRLKFTDGKNSEENFYTPFFRVKPKVPLLVKIVPAVAIVGGAVFFLKGAGGDKPTESKGSQIPTPDLP